MRAAAHSPSSARHFAVKYRYRTHPAYHSCAIIEAGERGLADVLSREFEPAPYALSSVLTCCDMTTSPDGELVPVERRLAEIHDRYGPGHLVSRSIQRATPMILGAVQQVQNKVARIA